jgi:GTPase SAR1 family protein/DNA-directed RNA polymerase subunit RPC12/RpoP
VDWRERTAEAFEKLVRACQTTVASPVSRGDGATPARRLSLGHTGAVWAVAYHPDGAHALSGSADRTVRLWDLATGACQQVLEGHTGAVWAVAYHPDGAHALSGSADGTVRLWDLATGVCQQVLEGHTGTVWAVAYHPDGITVLSCAHNGVLRVWKAETVEAGEAAPREDRVSYTNAKVLLIGESQAGKSGLAIRLAHDRWEPTESTVGAWASHFKVPRSTTLGAEDGTDREIWLWDFGGQADQRLIHQLYMGDTALAVLVFDGQRDETMTHLWEWDRACASAGSGFPKILVAGRTDINPVRLRNAQVEEFCAAAGFAAYFQTSAKDNVGCSQLREAIITLIDWSQIPWRSSPAVFQRLKHEILKLKDSGRVLVSVKGLRDWLSAQVGPFDPAELDAVIGLLAGPGAVLPLGFGDYVLLRPELINAYAQAVIKTLHDDPEERGCILEERVLLGQLNYPADFTRLQEADECIVLRAMYNQLVERPICLRDSDPEGKRATVLVFPSYFRRERPDRPEQPQDFMTYRFGGYLDDIYATLVVRLHHTEPFQSLALWRNAADFDTASGKRIGIRLITKPDGTGDLQIHCDAGTPTTEQALFAKYVHDHLKDRDPQVMRLRTYICQSCSTPVENRDAARRRLLDGKHDIGCSYCDERIELWDEIEQQLSSSKVRSQVEQMRTASQVALDSESRGRLLVGEVYAMAAQANQIARELTVSDYGIDMEIEFKTDDGVATGKKLYLQLKSGDSHLRRRKRDDQRVFRIKDARHADYWADQGFPVMLVVRDSSGAIEWMEISQPLRQQRATGPWPAREIHFAGEPFSVTSIRRWRDQELRPR